MAQWTAFAHASDFQFDAASVREHWARLHRCDAAPCPTQTDILDAWALYHNGLFEEAAEAGLRAGPAGFNVANRATAVYANYLEPRESTRFDLFQQVAQRAQAMTEQDGDNANAWYMHAYALGRYSQGISVAKALAQGLGNTIRRSLEKTIALAPRHADAHFALGTFHAEVIDKVGAMIGAMTHGANKDVAVQMFQRGLKLHPFSPIGKVEYAQALVMLMGDEKMSEANRLYEQAANLQPVDAKEWLEVEMAREELTTV